MRFEEIKAKIKNLDNYRSLDEIKKAGLRIIKNLKTGDYWLIEQIYLKTVIKSPQECKTVFLNEDKLLLKVFICNEDKKKLINTKALDYINWGEKQKISVKQGFNIGKQLIGYQTLETIKNRNNWYSLGERKKSDAVWVKSVSEIHGQSTIPFEALVDQRLYEISLFDPTIIDKLPLIINSTIIYLFKEISGRTNLGEGVLDSTVYEANNTLVINPSILPSTKINNYEFKSIFIECGIDPKKTIRDQEPSPLPDRKLIDDIVFDSLGLNMEERKEVYWSVCELVRNRLEKAKSYD